MDLQLVVFAVLAAVGVVSALMMVTRRNLVHAALYLVVTFFSVAAVYVLLDAEFLAAVQVLVYAGGIMVLFLFVIMLVDLPKELADARRSRKLHVTTALALTILTVGLLAYYSVRAGGTAPDAARAVAVGQGGNLEAVALSLFRYYLLPFEVVSVLLLAAMVGAILLAKARI